MTNYKILNTILNQIQSGDWNNSDIECLRQLLRTNPSETLQQIGKYNVHIEEGKEIHIGDRIYNSWDEEALSALVRMIQFGDPDEVHLLVTKLNNTRLKDEEGDRKTGSFYSYEIWLEDVSLEDAQDLTEGERHIQKYTIKGKWDSRVYKEINVAGFRVDTPWGHKKKPNGQFTVQIEIVNGRATLIKVQVDHYDDSANNYAAEKAEQLIQSKTREILRII
ncbi:MAG: hypothetical protein WBA77_05630 [Microcoleaceae cyanobacterium]